MSATAAEELLRLALIEIVDMRHREQVGADAFRAMKARAEAAESEVSRLANVNALRVPGSCQCGDNDLCAIAKHRDALISAGNTMRDIIAVAPTLPTDQWPTDIQCLSSIDAWDSARKETA